jgi:hypothetical protein
VIPLWAGICIVAWPVLHFIGGSWGEVAGAILEAIGLAVVGLRVLRTRATEEVSEEVLRPAVPEPAR